MMDVVFKEDVFPFKDSKKPEGSLFVHAFPSFEDEFYPETTQTPLPHDLVVVTPNTHIPPEHDNENSNSSTNSIPQNVNPILPEPTRRSTRQSIRPVWLKEFVALTSTKSGPHYPLFASTDFPSIPQQHIAFLANVFAQPEPTSGGRGLRQGDPMSPYLFTLIIEVFNIIMRKNIGENKDFKYHHKCRRMEITHLCFADDLLVFCHKDTKSVRVIKETLEEFSSYYVLKANMNKNTVFLGGMTIAEEKVILDIVPFAIGKLPVRHLGVPLITKKINATDLLSAMQIYWASAFLLPKNVIYEINKLSKSFLWCQRELTKGKAKAGLSIETNIADLVMSYGNNWPNEWINEYLILSQYGIPSIQDSKIDATVWVDKNEEEKLFSVKNVWKDMECDEAKVDWYKVVWFNRNIPRHARVLWMALLNRLSTQDRIAVWKPNDVIHCVFCKQCLDSIEHLFFTCTQEADKRDSFRRPVRGGVELQQLTDLVSLMDSVVLCSSHDRWRCDLSGDGDFSVKVIRNYIDDKFMPSHSEPSRCVRYIPIKINVFAWRARRDCLPTRVNLMRRGVTLDSVNCPLLVTMSEYLRFPFLSGATIEKGNALTNRDLKEQHTVPPLLVDQAIPDKTDHQKEAEVADPKIVETRERKARAVAKKREKKKSGANEEE
uniref:Reverse transcriptase domain-containing protein n=1 Tax=Tanacetum cinerariifolium TaxID=118510 RepID=A0A6L2K418_TANCI|nr:hypothetical protein [Tanacetum cinerariifolium]